MEFPPPNPHQAGCPVCCSPDGFTGLCIVFLQIASCLIVMKWPCIELCLHTKRFASFPSLVPIPKPILLFGSNCSLFRDEGRGALMAVMDLRPVSEDQGCEASSTRLASPAAPTVLPASSLTGRLDGWPGLGGKALAMFTHSREGPESLLVVFTRHRQGKLHF